MAVNFPNLPPNWRLPLFYADIDASQANTGQQVQRGLIIGQMITSGSGRGAGTPNKPQLSQGVNDAAVVGGVGSMLHLMTLWYRKRDPDGELYYLPLADNPSGGQASGSIKFTAVPTANGALSLYIGGVLVTLPVSPTQTLANLATALAAAITATPNLPLTAAVDGSDSTKVDLVAINAGPCGNDIDLRVNYHGTAAGEAIPAGLTANISGVATPGATNAGNGTITAPGLALTLARGIYSVVFTSATAFTVKDPNGNTVGTGTTGTLFNTGGISFTITAGGTAFVSGDTFSIGMGALSGGFGAPSLSAALANLGSKTFDFIAFPYRDSTSLDAMKTFLANDVGRWSYSQQLYGGFFTFHAGTFGQLVTLGTSRNDPHGSIMGMYDSPTPAFLAAANYAGAAATALRDDPALPLHTLALDVQPPPLASRFPLAECNMLAFDGISTCAVADDGTVSILTSLTTYQQNAFGQPDNSYLQVNTLYNLAFCLRFLRDDVTTKFARKKLAADGTRTGAGSNVVTPSSIRGNLIASYQQLVRSGNTQQPDLFAQNLVVEQNQSNPNRVDVLWPGTLIDQLDVFALLAQFRLQ